VSFDGATPLRAALRFTSSKLLFTSTPLHVDE
jgi:hypothetical protein